MSTSPLSQYSEDVPDIPEQGSVNMFPPRSDAPSQPSGLNSPSNEPQQPEDSRAPAPTSHPISRRCIDGFCPEHAYRSALPTMRAQWLAEHRHPDRASHAPVHVLFDNQVRIPTPIPQVPEAENEEPPSDFFNPHRVRERKMRNRRRLSSINSTGVIPGTPRPSVPDIASPMEIPRQAPPPMPDVVPAGDADVHAERRAKFIAQMARDTEFGPDGNEIPRQRFVAPFASTASRPGPWAPLPGNPIRFGQLREELRGSHRNAPPHAPFSVQSPWEPRLVSSSFETETRSPGGEYRDRVARQRLRQLRRRRSNPPRRPFTLKQGMSYYSYSDSDKSAGSWSVSVPSSAENRMGGWRRGYDEGLQHGRRSPDLCAMVRRHAEDLSWRQLFMAFVFFAYAGLLESHLNAALFVAMGIGQLML